eukprot:2439970-Prymnesium_polylepis.1
MGALIGILGLRGLQLPGDKPDDPPISLDPSVLMVQYVVGTYDAEIVNSELAFIKCGEEDYALLCGRAIARTLSKNKKDVPSGAATHQTRE